MLVEKPMALDGAAARRMIAEAERSGRILMTAQVIRFFPEYVALRNALPRLGRGPLPPSSAGAAPRPPGAAG